MAKTSFILYTDYIDQLALLSMEQRGILLTAIMYYQDGRELPEMDLVTQMAFSFIASRMKTNNEKYEETCKRRSENGKKGGRPKKEEPETETEEKQMEIEKANAFSEKQTKAKKANAFSEKQTKAKKADIDPVLVLEPVLGNDVVLGTDENIKPVNDIKADTYNNSLVRSASMSESVLTEEFNREIWDLYPRSRRNGKKKALASYIRDRKNGADKTEVILGINRYRAYITATHLEEKYIKQADTFFNQSAWQDAWEPPRGSVDHRYDDIKAWLDGKEASG